MNKGNGNSLLAKILFWGVIILVIFLFQLAKHEPLTTPGINNIPVPHKNHGAP